MTHNLKLITQNSKLTNQEISMTVTLTELAELRLRTFVRGTPNYTPIGAFALPLKTVVATVTSTTSRLVTLPILTMK